MNLLQSEKRHPLHPSSTAGVGEKALYILNDGNEWRKLMEHLKNSGVTTNAAAKLIIHDYLRNKEHIDETTNCSLINSDECETSIIDSTRRRLSSLFHHQNKVSELSLKQHEDGQTHCSSSSDDEEECETSIIDSTRREMSNLFHKQNESVKLYANTYEDSEASCCSSDDEACENSIVNSTRRKLSQLFHKQHTSSILNFKQYYDEEATRSLKNKNQCSNRQHQAISQVKACYDHINRRHTAVAFPMKFYNSRTA